ncbi:Enzyme of the cupin superfamily [Musa troglodytarum]|uniref:Enzyme of the cupin superfamily n=1 Tax=Musa troglodytarum TaxID=320322 RepID=A0A9E7F4F2_9LILI|nr:Enzyme of the cupin superfamily [Musa troglodytarum]
MASPTLTAPTPFSGGLFPARATRAQEKGRDPRLLRFRIRAETMATEKLGIKVERNPPESRLAELGVRQWPKWGCSPSKFPWTYAAKETCYLLEGKVKVFPKGHGDEFVEIQAGDLVEFPEGMSCTWDVSVAVDKHYNFD